MKKIITDIRNDIVYEEEKIEKNNKIDKVDEVITINKDNIITFFSGLGAALTPASTSNYKKLDSYNKNKFLKAYFEELKYKYIRLPIGSCDFAEYSYSYYKPFGIDMREDEINIEPLLDKIRDYNVSYMASPWTPPLIWKIPIVNRLRRTCYGRYAKYLTRYLQYYQKQNINIDYLSIQNEPSAYQRWESCLWSNHAQKVFIKKYMIPNLKKYNLNTSIMLHDHNKDNLAKTIDKLYIDDEKVGAVAFHWYTGSYFEELKKVHQKYPKLLLIESEMCCGWGPYDEKGWVGDAELYANEIIGNINSGMNIFVDWNLLLDENGGPNHKKNWVKSPIIRRDEEIIITPIFQYLKHFSLHAEQLVYETTYDKLKVVSSQKGNKTVITVLNNTDDKVKFEITDFLKDEINKHSIITYII